MALDMSANRSATVPTRRVSTPPPKPYRPASSSVRTSTVSKQQEIKQRQVESRTKAAP